MDNITQHTYNGFIKQAEQYGITKEAAGKLWEMLSKGLLSSESVGKIFGDKAHLAQRLSSAPTSGWDWWKPGLNESIKETLRARSSNVGRALPEFASSFFGGKDVGHPSLARLFKRVQAQDLSRVGVYSPAVGINSNLNQV